MVLVNAEQFLLGEFKYSKIAILHVRLQNFSLTNCRF